MQFLSRIISAVDLYQKQFASRPVLRRERDKLFATLKNGSAATGWALARRSAKVVKATRNPPMTGRRVSR
jgi:hypothetical protein